MRWLHDTNVNESKMAVVSGQRTDNTTLGKVSVPPRMRRGSPLSIGLFKLKSVEDDYLVCREWDGENEGSDDIYIAKNPEIRCSLEAKEIYGVENTYTYEVDPADPDELNKIRTATDGSTTEEQRVVPPWTLDELIYGIGPMDTDLVIEGETEEDPDITISLIMLHPRFWAQTAD